jgi:transposase-like protein
MKANVQSIRKRRIYSKEFKQQIVSEFESGKFSVLQMERLYGVSNATIYNWIYKFSTFNERGLRVVEQKHSHMDKVKELEKRIKELEGAVGRKQIKIDYLEKMIEIAKDKFDIDIIKNYDTPQSAGSEKTNKK